MTTLKPTSQLLHEELLLPIPMWRGEVRVALLSYGISFKRTAPKGQEETFAFVPVNGEEAHFMAMALRRAARRLEAVGINKDKEIAKLVATGNNIALRRRGLDAHGKVPPLSTDLFGDPDNLVP